MIACNILLEEFLNLTIKRKIKFLITAAQVLTFKKAQIGLVCSLLDRPKKIFKVLW